MNLLISSQVRKYLLRLRQEHVKFWRPQILLFINDPRRSFRLIQFCNSLKKGGLFVLGHVIVTNDFASAVPEAKRQQTAWTKYIDFSKIKAFSNIAISPALEWGTRNVVLSAGLGGMRPNIVIMGFYNLPELRQSQPLINVPTPLPSRPPTADNSPRLKPKRRKNTKDDKLGASLPTDANRMEGSVTAQSYVTILEDLLLRVQVNVAIAKGFSELELPARRPSTFKRAMSAVCPTGSDGEKESKSYIDLWPIQMSAEIVAEGVSDPTRRNVLTTNFDTYTLILQLGCILNTVPSWKRNHTLRVGVFVEYESDVEEERGRVTTLLRNLRIEAEVMVFWLASGDLKTYEVIVNDQKHDADPDALRTVEETLKEEEWWEDIQKMRGRRGSISASQELAAVEGVLGAAENWPNSSFQYGRRGSNATTQNRFEGLRKKLRKTGRKTSISGLSQMGISLGIQTHRLSATLAEGLDSASESSSTSESEGESDGFWDSDSEAAASENDVQDYRLTSADDDRAMTLRRSTSVGASSRTPFSPRRTRPVRTASDMSPIQTYTPDIPKIQEPGSHIEPSASDSPILEDVASPSDGERSPVTKSPRSFQRHARPPIMRHQSLPKFTSKPVPHAAVATDDGPGPSIMFTDQPSTPETKPRNSIYTTHSPTRQQQQQQASGFPSTSAIPLSFNDLPCRAQHLILNELISAQSGDTAVVFTTLPSPVEGTCEKEQDCVRYLSDLEVLCADLPPVLLVHSNSMTVTMNL